MTGLERYTHGTTVIDINVMGIANYFKKWIKNLTYAGKCMPPTVNLANIM